MTDSPLVSVVVPAYNASRYVVAAVESVLAQDHAPLEVICVDDGSTDETAPLLRAFGDRIVFLPCAHNGGIGRARNIGLHAARGDFIAFMDADDLWVPGKIALQMERLRREPRAAFCFGHMQCFVSPELPGAVRRLRHCPPDPMPGYVAATALVRRAVVGHVGGFDPGLRVGEFIDWFSRVEDAGFGVVLEDAVLLQRRIHDTNTGVTRRDSRLDYVRVVKRALDRRRAEAGDD